MRRAIPAAVVAALVLAAPATAGPDLVYRSSWGGGTYFHPLGSFSQLNRAVALGQKRKARQLATRLVERGVTERGSLVWRYHTRRDGPASWDSGLAQAVAAQSLARAGRLEDARRAYRAIPARLVTRTSVGPWIKLYSYSDVAVLNAQLQAAVSIADYARLANDPGARRLARELRRAAELLLPRFDTGSWSRYSLGGQAATLEYHDYVTSLLWKLSRSTGRPAFRAYAVRFRNYRHLPPRISGGPKRARIYPKPQDWYRDAVEVSFKLSKPATVTFRIAGGTERHSYGRGWNTYWWHPDPATPPRRYHVTATAVDWLGNARWASLGSVVVARDTTPPRIEAELAPWHLYWRGSDDESPWLSFALEVEAWGTVQTIPLGRGDFSGGRAVPAALDPTARVTLVAADSSGNATRLPLRPADGLPALGRIPY